MDTAEYCDDPNDLETPKADYREYEQSIKK